MMKIQMLLNNLTEQLNFIDLEIDDTVLKCEKSVEVTITTIQKVKKEILRVGFKSVSEEIHFFKEIKPQFTSKRIYYNSVYRIETKKPSGSTRIFKKYYNNELEKLKRYFDDNLDFYKYYRTKSTYLDYKYFVRGSFDVKQSLDNFYYETDLNFSTSHDFKIAKIIANDLLQLYLEDCIKLLDRKSNKLITQRNPNAKLIWTGSKIALTELLYALQTEGVFNNGSADLKIIAEFFEDNFSLDLGQYRRNFLEIRARKENRTKFLDTLKTNLLKRMDDTDESF
ncbi:RteC domain-containing protein [Chryseobacterium sp. Hurlbut01]|uniref:RteC domain-containing protein n=1 Tax=Chryseobacterium sp. Hurlbut01 TaxID=1681828 RepID=UPI001F1EBB8D|nr:RteC domain-containing protein [Chryseobacterium sp. Hurlbut01]